MNTVSHLNPNRFYVYGLFDHGVPFYIGKGQTDRAYQHSYEARQGSKMPVHCKIRSLNNEYETRILTDNLTQEDAFDLEELTIRDIGQRCNKDGPLLNLKPGGEGGCHTEETKRKISLAQKGKKKNHSKEGKEAMRRSMLGKKMSDEAKANLSAKMKNRKFTPEWRKKISDAKRGKKMSPEACAAMSAAQMGKKLSPETCAKISASRTGKKYDESWRKNISKNLKASYAENRVICPHCKKEGAKGGSMTRWHFDNCRFKTGDKK